MSKLAKDTPHTEDNQKQPRRTVVGSDSNSTEVDNRIIADKDELADIKIEVGYRLGRLGDDTQALAAIHSYIDTHYVAKGEAKELEKWFEDLTYRIFGHQAADGRWLMAKMYFKKVEELKAAIQAWHTTETEKAVRAARIDGLKTAKNLVIARTEIPKDAKNPTRDIVVVIGEECARIIDLRIETELQSKDNKEEK